MNHERVTNPNKMDPAGRRLKDMNLRLRTLTVFAGIRKDAVVAALEELLAADSGNAEEFAECYCSFAAALYERDTDWSRYLHSLVLEDDNICVRRAAAAQAGENRTPEDVLGPVLAESLARELAILQDLSALSSEEVRMTPARVSSEEVRMDVDGVPGEGAAAGCDKDSPECGGYLPRWETSEYDFAADYEAHLKELPRRGYGIYARYHVFRVDGTQLVPVLCPDPQRILDLVGYDAQREPVIDNTKAFLQGLPANNVLLYGDAGTGKSSTVKAIANEYRDEGLRLIEIKQSQLKEIPAVLEALAGNPLHFILFIDDLSFDSGNEEFIALKNILEGGAYDTRGNVLIYATSNRRHFVKEDASARTGNEMFVNDSIQETMSLAARFGLTVTFQKPKKDLYLEIVEALAERSGIEMDRYELRIQAEAFAIRASGRSPRTARQFVDTVNIQRHLAETPEK